MSPSRRKRAIVLVLALRCMSLAAATAPNRKPQQLSKLTFEELRQCHLVEENCKACWTECHSARRPFFGSEENVQLHEDVVSSLQECVRETMYYRQWLPEWCINDLHGYYVTKEFSPSTSTCLLQPFSCSENLEIDSDAALQQGNMSTSNYNYVLSKRIGGLGRAQQNLSDERKRFEKKRKEISQIARAWEEKWLEEATFHLKNPEETKTKYADPVFQNYTGMIEENGLLDAEIFRHDMKSASRENDFVRRDTILRIPGYISAIAKLQNHIHSHKGVTDQYLRETKLIAARTAELQRNATNIIYETTHSASLDGEIVLLDQDLLDLYAALKEERAFLSQSNVRSTFAKLRLVGVMRRMIQHISEEQKRSGCRPSDIMGF